MNDIYELLKSGMTAEEIAAEFTQSLNDAETRIESERLEAERLAEAKREEAARHQRHEEKRKDFAQVIYSFLSAIGKHYPELHLDMDLSEEDCASLADLAIMVIDLEALKASRPKVNKPTPDEVFADFFKSLGM